MIRRIVLENYMAHVRTVIEPAEGLTVIIGPNNCGKSAIIHALEMICYNSDAADFAIRHGTKKATVTVETEDENGVMHTLVWWRTKGTAGYSIDGREISGLGRSVPDDLHDHLRMPKIEPAAGGDPFFIHFGLQKSPIFLLDEASSRAAHFFASSSDADKLVEMQTRHAQKTSSAKRDKEKVDGRLDELDKQLQILSPLPALSDRLGELELDHLKLVALAEMLESIEEFIDEFSRATERALASQTRLQTLAELQQPPVLHELGPLVDLARSMAANARAADQNGAFSSILVHLHAPPALKITTDLSLLCARLAEVGALHAAEKSRAEALRPLNEPPVPHDVPRLRQITGEIEKADAQLRLWEATRTTLLGLINTPQLHDLAPLTRTLAALEKQTRQSWHHHSTCTALKDLPLPPPLTDPADLRQRIDSIEAAMRNLALLDAHRDVIGTLRVVPEMTDIEPLDEFIRRTETARQLEAETRAQAAQAGKKLDQLRHEIEVWIEDHPNCITCGQAVSAELIFSGGHTHE